MVAQSCGPRTQEAEAEGLPEVQGYTMSFELRGKKKAEKQKPQEAQLKDEESRAQRADGNQLTGPKGGDEGERMVTRPDSFSPCPTRPGGEVPPCTQRS